MNDGLDFLNPAELEIDPDYSSDYYYDWDAYHEKYGIETRRDDITRRGEAIKRRWIEIKRQINFLKEAGINLKF